MTLFLSLCSLTWDNNQKLIQPIAETPILAYAQSESQQFVLPVLLKVNDSKRSMLLEKAEKFITSHLQQPLTLRDLYEHLQVSERTLRYSFQECLGISPMTYLKVQRLNGVRRELKACAPETRKVNLIASHWGFWHMGQFSQDYKKLFGESPSQTVAKTVGNGYSTVKNLNNY